MAYAIKSEKKLIPLTRHVDEQALLEGSRNTMLYEQELLFHEQALQSLNNKKKGNAMLPVFVSNFIIYAGIWVFSLVFFPNNILVFALPMAAQIMINLIVAFIFSRRGKRLKAIACMMSIVLVALSTGLIGFGLCLNAFG